MNVTIRGYSPRVSTARHRCSPNNCCRLSLCNTMLPPPVNPRSSRIRPAAQRPSPVVNIDAALLSLRLTLINGNAWTFWPAATLQHGAGLRHLLSSTRIRAIRYFFFARCSVLRVLTPRTACRTTVNAPPAIVHRFPRCYIVLLLAPRRQTVLRATALVTAFAWLV